MHTSTYQIIYGSKVVLHRVAIFGEKISLLTNVLCRTNSYFKMKKQKHEYKKGDLIK